MHRYPFLLVDRVIEFEAGKSATGYKMISSNEQFFNGHFPSRAIMPGVVSMCVVFGLGKHAKAECTAPAIRMSFELWWRLLEQSGLLCIREKILSMHRMLAGVLQVEAMAQLAGIVMIDPEKPEQQENFFFGGIENCKFRRPVVPGDQLVGSSIKSLDELHWAIEHSICTIAFVG